MGGFSRQKGKVSVPPSLTKNPNTPFMMTMCGTYVWDAIIQKCWRPITPKLSGFPKPFFTLFEAMRTLIKISIALFMAFLSGLMAWWLYVTRVGG